MTSVLLVLHCQQPLEVGRGMLQKVKKNNESVFGKRGKVHTRWLIDRAAKAEYVLLVRCGITRNFIILARAVSLFLCAHIIRKSLIYPPSPLRLLGIRGTFIFNLFLLHVPEIDVLRLGIGQDELGLELVVVKVILRRGHGGQGGHQQQAPPHFPILKPLILKYKGIPPLCRLRWWRRAGGWRKNLPSRLLPFSLAYVA